MYGQLPEVTTADGQTLHGIKVRVANPPKEAILRLPTAQEILDRTAKQKIIRTTVGRRQSEQETVQDPKSDLDLFTRLRLDKGPEFDEFEAANAIGRLTACEVTDCQRAGDQYEINVKTPFGETVHTMGIPTVKDIMLYRRTVVKSRDLPHGREELRFRVEPAVTLYDATMAEVSGYVDNKDVPPHHKSAVVFELISALDELDASFDPNS